MILADEGLNGNIVSELRKKGIQVTSVQEKNAGISDKKVIELAKKDNLILITEDKDFGEWVFAHKIKGLSIIFLRYGKSDFKQVLTFLISLIETTIKQPNKSNFFITINKHKVRKRAI